MFFGFNLHIGYHHYDKSQLYILVTAIAVEYNYILVVVIMVNYNLNISYRYYDRSQLRIDYYY
jgi:hypothetical protein